MKSVLGRLGGLVAMVVLAACSGGQGGLPQQAAFSPLAVPAGTTTVTNADYAAAISVRAFTYHLMPLRTHAGRQDRTLIYPAQLADYGGPRITSAEAIDVFVNCKAQNESCFTNWPR